MDADRYPMRVFTKEELLAAKAECILPGIWILGFQPISALKDYHQLQPSLFVYPDDRQIKNSATVFIALHETMLRSNRLAVCCYYKSENSQQKLAALVPQQETLDQDGVQVNLALFSIPSILF